MTSVSVRGVDRGGVIVRGRRLIGCVFNVRRVPCDDRDSYVPREAGRKGEGVGGREGGGREWEGIRSKGEGREWLID